ncbi:alpha/beta hydrolase [Mucilaginibacter sp. UR6-1]|uniref:alpha/beta fold hydrolase n=1 Tax=Mucilaginibacter sp. UR6-1 TaxID=1435643 RepID=UPI001E456C2B|nr:alpha/beta hydrolase [Mucilaginibacter sp. UR6-1]MCC8409816.1 alpha/beta hydrolase [Mucilaginibacter sp. UR6-1]
MRIYNILTVLLLLCGLTLTASAQKYGSNAAVGKYVKIRGFKMYYETYGSGKPLLMVHGNGGSIGSFENQIPYFAKNYKVIAVDSRAQGKSTDLSDSLSYDMMADDLNALLDTLQIKDCYVVGWSDGGINGLALSLRHPDKVAKLAITGANLRPDTTTLHPFVYNLIAKTDKDYSDSIKRFGAKPLLKNARKVNHMMLVEPKTILADLHKVQCPVLVIGGDHDAIPTRHTIEIAQHIPLSYLWIIPNSGHSTLVNYKDQFNNVVEHFFKTPYRPISGEDRFN